MASRMTTRVIGRREGLRPILEEVNHLYNAFTCITLTDDTTVTGERGGEEIGQQPDADHGQSQPMPMPLQDVLVSVKDNINIRGYPTTCASPVLRNYYPSEDATVISLLRRAGAQIVAKTNMDEMAMGAWGISSSLFGPVKNPRDPTRVPGGSSAGAAASLASGAVQLALGSDTGGSIRVPAAYCGVLGLRPSWGRLSRQGLVSYASSLDTIGLMARDWSILRRALEVTSGASGGDATWWSPPPDRLRTTSEGGKKLSDLRLGILLPPRDLTCAKVQLPFAHFLARLPVQNIIPISLPSLSVSLPAYYVLALIEAASCLARYGGRTWRGGLPLSLTDTQFGESVQRRLILGQWMGSHRSRSTFHPWAQSVREALRQELQAVLSTTCDLIISPTSPLLPPSLSKFGREHEQGDRALEQGGEGEQVWEPARWEHLLTAISVAPSPASPASVSDLLPACLLDDLFTVPASLAGLPALTFPLYNQTNDAGDGQPFIGAGVQVMAAAGRDEELLHWSEQLMRASSPSPSSASSSPPSPPPP